MTIRSSIVLIALYLGPWATPGFAAEPGDPDRGARLFGACAACHSVAPDRHMTGPSLAAIWRREAGSVAGFPRYSSALRQADVIWDEDSLDAWLANPRALIPGNRMTFRGIADGAQRRDIVAYLRWISEQEQPTEFKQAHGGSEGMMREGGPLDLETVQANSQVASVGHCGDTYTVVTESGESHAFWEFNLRIKTDGGENGPRRGEPVLIPGGMMGDRAFLVFASPDEISPFIKSAC